MKLENNDLIVEISSHGAEISRIFNKNTGKERLWNADGRFWKRSSPVLFPVVGKLYGGLMRTDVGEYAFSQHGFARDMEFVCTAFDRTSAEYELRSDENTLKKYPWRFLLRITYTINGKRICIRWHVENEGEGDMPFTIGGHPAFCFDPETPEKEDHYVYIPGAERLRYRLLNTEYGCAEDTEAVIETDNGYVRLSEEMFANDALIFDDGQISEAVLCDHDRNPLVIMNSEGFPNFGIWSVKDAPFVCLEPWQGRCDNVGFTDLFRNKSGAVCLASGQTFEKSYSITIV